MLINSSVLMLMSEQNMLNKMEAVQGAVKPDVIIANHQFDLTEPSSISFADTFKSVLDGVNQHQQLASQKMTAVETGASDDLVGAMIASQQASLSFSALMQVRNKLVSSFEDIMRMPV